MNRTDYCVQLPWVMANPELHRKFTPILRDHITPTLEQRGFSLDSRLGLEPAPPLSSTSTRGTLRQHYPLLVDGEDVGITVALGLMWDWQYLDKQETANVMLVAKLRRQDTALVALVLRKTHFDWESFEAEDKGDVLGRWLGQFGGLSKTGTLPDQKVVAYFAAQVDRALTP